VRPHLDGTLLSEGGSKNKLATHHASDPFEASECGTCLGGEAAKDCRIRHLEVFDFFFVFHRRDSGAQILLNLGQEISVAELGLHGDMFLARTREDLVIACVAARCSKPASEGAFLACIDQGEGNLLPKLVLLAFCLGSLGSLGKCFILGFALGAPRIADVQYDCAELCDRLIQALASNLGDVI